MLTTPAAGSVADFAPTPLALPSAVCAAVVLAAGVTILLRERFSRLGRIHFLLSLVVALWQGALCASVLSATPVAGQFWAVTTTAFAVLITPLEYLFALSIAGRRLDRGRSAVWVGAAALCLLAVLFGTELFVPRVNEYSWGYFSFYGPAGWLFIAFTMAVVGSAQLLYLRLVRDNPRGGFAWRRGRLLLFGVTAGSIGAVDFLPTLGFDVFPFGGIGLMAANVINAWATWRYRLVEITPAFAAQQFMDTVSDGVMVLDRDGMVRLLNPALSEMLGYEAGQLLHAAPPEAVSRMLFGQAGAGQFPEAGYVSQERQYQAPGGARRTLSVSMSLMKDGGGEALAAVATIRDITQAVAAQEQIQKLAYYDALTNLPNRLLLKERFSRAIARAERARGQAAVLFLDLDRFKQVNDTLGHDAGDQLLKAVAERVVKCVRESDLVVRNAQSEEAEEEAGGTTLARLGGDEFVLLLSPIERGEDAAKVARRILQSLSQPVKVKGGVEVGTGVSIGISLYPGDGEDAETLMKKADLAMYHAKETGRNGFRFFDQEFNDRVVKRFGFETSLRRAMGGPELLLGYRPVVDAAGRAVGLVAEVEWEHPQKGRLGADEFLPGALDSGLVGPLYDWLLRTTTFQLRAWNGSSLGSPWVLVPVDAGVFERTGLVETVRESLAQTRLDPARLVIALGGLTARMDRARLLPVLAALQGLGVRLALDGFGSGRVSLADVTGVPVRMVRMVAPPADDEDARALAEALLRMVHGLGLQAVAGGAVDVGAVRVARELGFDFVCGDGVAPAVHAEDVVETVARLATGGAGAPA